MDTPAEPDSGKTPAKKPAGSAKRPAGGAKSASGQGSAPRSGASRKPAGSAARTSGARSAAPAKPEPPVTERPPVADDSSPAAPVEQRGPSKDEAEKAPRPAFTAPKLTVPTLSAGSSAIARLGQAVDAQRHAEDDAAEAEAADLEATQHGATRHEDGGAEPTTDAEPGQERGPEAEIASSGDGEAEVEAEAESEAEPIDEPELAASVVDVRPASLPVPVAETHDTAMLTLRGLTKRFDDTVAVNAIDLEVPAGTICGIVGPNGAGKTTTLSMITGLLRPDAGTVVVHGADVWADPVAAKRQMGVLPDRLRLFDRLTGSQLLYYSAVLRGLDSGVARTRVADLGAVFRIEDALGRLVSDYSSGMTKKVALAAAMIHAPRLLVLDEPFESVDPVSAATVTDILRDYTAAGGTVLLSSHSMALVERICDRVAVVVDGEILADGTVEEVRGDGSLEERFIQLAGSTAEREGVEWLHSFSD